MYQIKKRITLKNLFFLWLILTLSGFNALSFADNLPINRSQQLQKQLDDTRKQNELNAMALTVISPKISARPLNFFSGMTQKNKGRAIRTSDYFQIGSNTKSFVAALLIKLQSDKVLSLDDPITKWLPEYKLWDDVKIRNLLHNNSGLRSYTATKAFLKDMEAFPTKQYLPADLIHYSYKTKIIFKPGQGWDYSNTNWILAGMIAEKATQHSLSYLFNKYFLSTEKLNLSNTAYVPYVYDKSIMQRIVHGYNDSEIDVTKRNMSWAASAGAMLQSNEDLAYWAYDLFHTNALNAEELAQMQQVVSTTTGQDLPEGSLGYGLGIGLKMTQAGQNWGHEGRTEGFHSIFAYFPEDDIIISAHANGLKNADFQDFAAKIVMILRDTSGN